MLHSDLFNVVMQYFVTNYWICIKKNINLKNDSDENYPIYCKLGSLNKKKCYYKIFFFAENLITTKKFNINQLIELEDANLLTVINYMKKSDYKFVYLL